MSSTITNFSSNIDTGYPVPGQDNDTQGFRDIFGNIKNAFDVTAAEITDIQVIQEGIASQLSNITTPTIFTGTTINSVSIVNSGDITTQGRFIGDGSLITNIPFDNITSIGTLTNLFVANNINVGVAVISTANNYLNISGVNQLYFADHKYAVVPKLYTTTANSTDITLDYNNGRYQKVTVDVTGNSLTSLKITNWPTSGNYSPISVEVGFTGANSAFVANTEFRSSCTTYGSTSTIVSVYDRLVDGYLGTAGLARGYGVFLSSTVTASTDAVTYIDKVVDNRTITVFPGYNFVEGTTYYFAPVASDLTQLYEIRMSTTPGQTLRFEETVEATSTYNITNRVVYHLYSYDGGATIYYCKRDLYN
jgi:hypothetical protein